MTPYTNEIIGFRRDRSTLDTRQMFGKKWTYNYEVNKALIYSENAYDSTKRKYY